MFKNIYKAAHIPLWLFILMTAVIILRIPSFFEPYSYGDEMIYLTLGEAIRQNVPLYSGVHDNKPPLLYITAAIAGSLFWFKAILAFWHLLTIFVFWKFSERLFKNKFNLHKVAVAIFSIFTTIPLLEGNIVNAELFMIGPSILGFYLLLFTKSSFRNIFLAGTAFSVATLYKVPALFDIPAIVFYWIATEKINTRNIVKICRKTFFLALGIFIPIIITVIWYHFRGALKEYLIAAFLQNVGYLSSWRPDDVKDPFLVKNAPLLKRLTILSLGHILLFWKRNKISKQFLFLTSWLLLTLFAVTLSERPYPHYLIQSIAPVSLLAAIMFTFQNIEQVLVIIPLSIAILTPVYYNFWRYPTLSYYSRFFGFALNKIPKEQYISTFGGNVSRNYKISKFIVSNTEKKDKIFVWGDNATIYALSRHLPPGKYVADYHIKDFSSKDDTIRILSSDMPRILVILPDSENFTELKNFAKKYYINTGDIEGAEIWMLLKKKP